MEKVIRDGKAAILYSPGFGAGWFTWNSDYPECVFHPKIVELVERGNIRLITDDFMKTLLGCDYFCTLGAFDLKIEWLPIGTAFKIEEYDGSESITTNNELIMVA